MRYTPARCTAMVGITFALTVVANSYIKSALHPKPEPAYVQPPFDEVSHHEGFIDGGAEANPHEHVYGSKPRSPHWSTVRAAYMQAHPWCEACAAKTGCEVHHIISFHNDASKELDPENFVVLCRPCHFAYGHACEDGHSNWGECSNPNVREDAAEALMKKFCPKLDEWRGFKTIPQRKGSK